MNVQSVEKVGESNATDEQASNPSSITGAASFKITGVVDTTQAKQQTTTKIDLKSGNLMSIIKQNASSSSSLDSGLGLTKVSLVNDPITTTNRVTLVPLNNTLTTASKTSSPIKIITDVNSQTPKKLIQIPGNGVPAGGTIVGLTKTTTTNVLSNVRPPITTTTTSSTTPTKILTLSGSNPTTTTTTSSDGKIQYVKIVNTAQSPASSQTTTNSPIKITTIKPNSTSTIQDTNSRLTSLISGISATSGNNNNNNSNSSAPTTTIKTIQTKPIISKVNPSSISSAQSANNTTNSILFDVINSTNSSSMSNNNNNSSSSVINAPTIQSQSSIIKTGPLSTAMTPTTTRIQLITTNGQPQSGQSPARLITGAGMIKTPIVSKIQSPTTIKSPLVKTINNNNNGLSTTTGSESVPDEKPPITTTNYKVLTQQLPPVQSHSSNIITLKTIDANSSSKPILSANSSTGNRIVITKTISSSANDDPNKKQILATTASFKSENNDTAKLFVSSTTPVGLTPIANSKFNKTTEAHSLNREQQMENSLTSTASNIPNVTKTSNIMHLENANLVSSPHKQFSPTGQQSLQQQQHQYQTISVATNSQPVNSSISSPSSSNVRKPCNCTKSMCLKLYCDCFAMGSFCHDCNCINCYNTLEHEDERNKAIKMVLDRNPQAFQSKIGKFTAQIAMKTLPYSTLAPAEPADSGTSSSLKRSAAETIDEIQSRHVKGCNCKKSNCLKRYCECYLAKIQCTALCKCVGCKNCDESTRALLQLANAADLRKQQQQQQQQQLLQQQQQQPQLIHNQQQQTLHGKLFSGHKSSIHSLNGTSSKFANSEFMDHIDPTVDYFMFDKKYNEKHLNLMRSYSQVVNSSIESTCSRLIDRVSAEMEKEKLNEKKPIEHDEDEEMTSESEMTTTTTTTTPSTTKATNKQMEEQLERCLIEEFGQCLVEMIRTAEQNATNNTMSNTSPSTENDE